MVHTLPFAAVDAAIKFADHASQQSLLWLIIVLMIALGAFAWFVINYLVRREEARQKHDDAMTDARVKALLENTEVMRGVQSTMAQVTVVLQEVSIILRQHRDTR